ncbi:MAG: DUF1592 domain-containing protein [Planctomycetota bacterium]|nr:MAG: DUF1592 domain-containing protein [Planctomycetota bacterium]
MPRPARLILWFLVIACAALYASRATADEPVETESAEMLAEFRGSVGPLLSRYCSDCHSGEEPMGDLAIDELVARADVEKDRQAWETIGRKLHNGEMPPEDADQPDEAGLTTMTGWIDGQLVRFGCGDQRDPGRVTIRRLNRNEYNNTIRDLFGVDFHPADDFPSDDVGYGFDNIGDVLSMPTILLEKYLAAAEKVTARALGTELANLAEDGLSGGSEIEGGGRKAVSTSNVVQVQARLFGTGLYMVRVKAWGQQAGDEVVRMAVYLDDELVRRFEVAADERVAAPWYEGWISTRGGRHTVKVKFENDYYNEGGPEPNDRNLLVGAIEVMGPYPAEMRRTIPREHMPQDKLALAREIIVDVMSRAYRRPVTDEEVARVMQLVKLADDGGESFNVAIGLGVQAILVSPHFLFRVELDPEPNNPDVIRELNDYELATRLSYFLWSSMPDDELFTLARLGLLRKGEHLERQVRRMLADPKADALVENFGVQWLQLRNLAIASPDAEEFPGFDESLRRSMRRETELFFASVMREDRSVLDFIDGDFTFVDERLARHYGMDDVKGEEFRRVSLEPQRRGGVLTHGSVLTVTSNPTRTSPVKRGKWVLEVLLGTPPPPPPPDVPELEEAEELTGSLRERLEQHRENAACAVCHKRMDPLGFGLENYDGIGAWRTQDGPYEIDPSGELPGGQTFAGPQELKQILKAQSDEFVRCLSEKMLTYGLGRGVEYSDRCTVDDIVAAVKANDYKFSSLIIAIVRSDAFGKRRGKGSES